MKNIFQITLILMGMFILHSQEILAQSESAKSAYQRGISAYKNENFTQAFPDLMLAASAKIPEAFGPLIDLYVEGEYDGSGKGNYKEAMKWVVKGMDAYLEGNMNNKDLAVTCLMNYDPICFLSGDYQETIDHVSYGFETGAVPKMPYVMIQVAASHLKLGNLSQANTWLKDAISLAREKNDDYSLHAANALLSKIAFDNKDYAKALELAQSAASQGKVPLAAFVYGASLVKTNNNPDVGKQWVKAAAEYDYCGLFEINCFEEEIKQYWNNLKRSSL